MTAYSGPSIQAPSPIITRIVVEDLFGLFTYKLTTSLTTADGPNLLILYGENGSGKTTLLRLIQHLLSPEQKKGHRSAIARTRFKRFEVEIGGRTTISAVRNGGSLIGTFTLDVSRDSRTLASFTFEANKDLMVTSRDNSGAEMALYVELDRLGTTFHYLGDDRKHNLLSIEEEPDYSDIIAIEHAALTYGDRLISRRPRLNKSIDSVSRATSWIRQQALKATASGSEQADNVFATVIGTIATYGNQEKSKTKSIDEMITEIMQIETTTADFSKYGLVPPFDAENLVASIRRADGSTYDVISSILRPHLDGMSARLAALDQTRALVDTFVSNLNSFYSHKTISFDLKKGFSITSSNGDSLDPELLSSGETQLLLVMCNILSTRDSVSVFIVDEPEISLNVTWQRKLVDAFLSCMTGTSSQLVLATHSIELLTQYNDHVAVLR